MALVTLQNIEKYYGTQDVLGGICADVNRGDKIGLIGANGSGKSTILRIIAGTEAESRGTVSREPGTTIGFVTQYQALPPDRTVRQTLLSEIEELHRQLRELEERMGSEHGEALERTLGEYQGVRDAYDLKQGDEAYARCERILDSLGMGDRAGQTVTMLSGGERNTLAIARSLMDEPDLLLLDEPGNHLDYVGLDWLETFLRGYEGAVVLVSHNRYLLDRAVGCIWELENRALSVYDGNYSDYRIRKLRALVAQRADYVANQKRLQRLETLVERFAAIARTTADPAWGRRLRARRTQLAKAREAAVDKPELVGTSFSLGIEGERSAADIALQVSGYTKRFGERTIFEDAELLVRCGSRVALVGANGSGKTTFLRDVVEVGDWENPALRVGPSMRIGYCDQEQAVFDKRKSVLDTFLELGAYSRHDVYSILSQFLFRWEDLEKKVGDLSGGEQNRLQLARLLTRRPNFLILDEPTNHLDIPGREAMEEGIEDFDGTVLVVSHDRYFLDKIADVIVEISEQSFHVYEGNFSEYWASRGGLLRRGKKIAGKSLGELRKSHAAKAATSAAAARSEPGRRSGSKAVQSRDIVARIEELEREKVALEKDVAEAFERGRHQDGRKLSNKLEALIKRLDELYRRWEESER